MSRTVCTSAIIVLLMGCSDRSGETSIAVEQPSTAGRVAVDDDLSGHQVHCLLGQSTVISDAMSSDSLRELKDHFALCEYDPDKVEQILEILISREDADAMTELAVIYINTHRHPRRSLDLLRSAAEDGNRRAEEILSEYDRTGSFYTVAER